MKPTPFMGNDGEVFQLDDGSFWEIKYEYEYLYEYYPAVIVCPSSGELIIDGKRLSISPVSARPPKPTTDTPKPAAGAPKPTQEVEGAGPAVVESQIDGDFEGWEGETIVKLVNGQIWQQTSYHYEYHYAFMPDVLIFRSGAVYKMQVEGVDEAVTVERLK
jgi:hypothetical protein